MQKQSHKKIAFIVSSPMIIKNFLVSQIHELSVFYDISVISNLKNNDFELLNDLPQKIKIYSIPIERKIKIYDDIKATFLLYRLIRQKNFDLIHSVSPKAGLISTFVGFITNVPVRIHTFTGQVWATKKGFQRFILKFFDKVLVKFSTDILVDSFSQKKFLIEENILKNSCGLVLASGSISGVDLQRFKPNIDQRDNLRLKYGISQKSFVLLFVGRLKKDKGIFDLIDAYLILKKKKLNIDLIIVGPDEENCKNKITSKLSFASEKVHFFSFSKQPEDFMCLSNVFIMPSYREGFGTSVIEAAACGLPTIASNIYGLNDAVVNHETGILFQVKNYKELSDKIEILYNDRNLCNEYGQNALKRVKNFFSQEQINSEIISFYKKKFDLLKGV